MLTVLIQRLETHMTPHKAVHELVKELVNCPMPWGDPALFLLNSRLNHLTNTHFQNNGIDISWLRSVIPQ